MGPLTAALRSDFYAVSARGNNVANDDAECAAPVEVAQKQARLWRRDSTGLGMAECSGTIRPDHKAREKKTGQTHGLWMVYTDGKVAGS